MLWKVIYKILILSTFTFYCNGIHVSEFNKTNIILTINSQLSELRVGQEKLTNEVAKDSDIQFIRAEIERLKKCELDKEADSESSRADIQVLRADIQNLRDELKHQKKYILEKESAIQSLGAEIQVLKEDLEQQKKCVIDKEADNQSLRADIQVFRTEIQNLRTEWETQKNLDKEVDIQSLRADLEKQNKDVLQKESHIQSLRGEVERLGKLAEGLVKESDEHRSWLNPHNCTEAKFNGIYDILIPKFSNQTFKVACDAQTHNGGWTIILRRIDGSVNFNRNWTEYKNGFGNLDGEYFLGLDKIHAMTEERRQELMVYLEDFEGEQRYETYDEFAIGNEDQQYELHTLGEASGTAGDSLSYHRGEKFTTFDNDNDYWEEGNCADRGTGAWWYNGGMYCQDCQLTGTYKDNDLDKGVTWDTFRGYRYSLKTAIMMIRPKGK